MDSTAYRHRLAAWTPSHDVERHARKDLEWQGTGVVEKIEVPGITPATPKGGRATQTACFGTKIAVLFACIGDHFNSATPRDCCRSFRRRVMKGLEKRRSTSLHKSPQLGG